MAQLKDKIKNIPDAASMVPIDAAVIAGMKDTDVAALLNQILVVLADHEARIVALEPKK